jgi:HlyD family secretion protein
MNTQPPDAATPHGALVPSPNGGARESAARGDGPASDRVGPLPHLVVSRNPVPATAPRGRLARLLRTVRFLPLIPLLLMTGAVVGLYFQPPGVRFVMGLLGLRPGDGTTMPIAVPAPPRPPAGTAAPKAPAVVVGLGKILPDGEVVTVAPPYGAGDARIAHLAVREGDRVEKGALLATLDNEHPLKAAAEAARATVAAREAALAQIRGSVRASRAEAEATLARSESTADTARREYDRAESLRARGVNTDATLEQRRAARDEALREVERARATLSRYSGDLDAQADVRVADRNLDAARVDLDRALVDVEKSQVRAPMAGTILSIQVRPGEKPGALGILNIGDLATMTVEVEVYQTQIGRIDIGQPVEVTAESLPGRLAGTVRRIGLEVGRQSLVDATPAANTDARVVKVTVELDPASSALARRFTNLQVIARITVEKPS